LQQEIICDEDDFEQKLIAIRWC